MDVEVRGADQLAALSKRLRAAGSSGKGLRRELFASIQRATKGVRADVQESWRSKAPHRGGLSSRPIRVSAKTRSGGQRVGVRLVTASRDGYSLSTIDQGRLRHRVFGRNVWVDQRITPGIITDPQEAAAPDVRAEVLRAIESINRKIEG